MKIELLSIPILFMLLLNFSGNALTAQNIPFDNHTTWTVLPGNVGDYGLQFDTVTDASRISAILVQPIEEQTVLQIFQTDSTLRFRVIVPNSSSQMPNFRYTAYVDSTGILRVILTEGVSNIVQPVYYDIATICFRKRADLNTKEIRGIGFEGDAYFWVVTPTAQGK